MLGLLVFFTQADHYEDFNLESEETLEVFAKRMVREGFRDESRGRWIMPGAIAWVEPRN